jgi:hypothetical protein
MDSVNVQIYKIDIGKLIFVKKDIDFDRKIKKSILYFVIPTLYLLCLVIKTIFWPAFDMFIVCLYKLDLLISKGYWRCRCVN